MAHELRELDGMIYNVQNGLPWHKLGTPLNGLATINEVLEACPPLAREVVLEKVYTGEGLEVYGKYAPCLLMDDGKRIPFENAIVGSQYRVLQNRQAFEFFDAFCADPNGPKYETAGTLYNGRKVWILAKLPDVLEVVPGDIVEPYILLSNSHDGTSAVTIQETPIRVVCNNTLNMALNMSVNRKHKIRHSGDIFTKVSRVQDALGIVREQFAETANLYKQLAQVEPTHEQIEQVLTVLFPPTASARAENQKERVRILVDRGTGTEIDGVRGTGWGLYNAVTELVDHTANLGSKRPNADDMRLNALWFGNGAKVKETALEAICQVMEVGV